MAKVLVYFSGFCYENWPIIMCHSSIDGHLDWLHSKIIIVIITHFRMLISI